MTRQFHNTLLDSFHIHVYIKANLPPFAVNNEKERIMSKIKTEKENEEIK